MCIRNAILPSRRVILAAALFSLAMHVVGALLSFECHFNLCGLPRPGISMIEASFRGIFYALDVLSFVCFYVLSSCFFTFILFSFLSMLLFSISLKKRKNIVRIVCLSERPNAKVVVVLYIGSQCFPW